MTDLNDFFYTDGLHDVLAAYVNSLVAGNLRGELTNTETLSADKTLNDASFPIQNLTPSAANRSILLPPEAATNHQFFFRNVSATFSLVIKDDSGVTTFATISPGRTGTATPIAGTTWSVSERQPATTAINDVQMGDGNGSWIKKTLAELKTLLGLTGTNSGDQTIKAAMGGNGLRNVVAGGVTSYMGFFDSEAPNATENNVAMYFPYNATLKNLRIRTQSGQPATGTLVFTIRIGGSDTNIVATLAAGTAASLVSDTTHTANVTANQLVSMKVVNGADANSAQIASWSIEADAT